MAAKLWGGETAKAIENFPVSGEPIPASVAHWLGRIKAAAARVNAELGLLDAGKAERIAAAGDRIANGELDDQFPIDVFQTGSGTSSNMNANEVIATLAGEGVHANDDVNMGQSSNDVFPSAVHLAALGELVGELVPALGQLEAALAAKSREFEDVVKSGRTHWMDAVPVTLGQEFGGYAAQVREGAERIGGTLGRLGKIPLGGTAVGTGLNTHPEFAARVRARMAADTGLTINPPADPFESQAARDGLVEASGALKTVAVSLTKIANDLRFMGSGPRAGLAEIYLPELQKGSSIMPGKVNPVIPEVVTQVAAQVIGNDAAIAIGGMQGHFELNVFIPLMARNLLDSIRLLASASRLLADKCVGGIEANRERCERYAELTLSAATALNPFIGYDRAAEIVKEASRSGRSLREVAREAGIDDDTLDRALDYRAMARPAPEPGSPLSQAVTVGERAAAGRSSVPLLVGPVARADERAREHRSEPECLALLPEPAELVGVHPAVDRRVLRARLEVLADRDHVDAVLAQVAHRLDDLVVPLSETDDDPALRHHRVVGDFLRAGEQPEGAVVAGLPAAHPGMQAADGLDVVVEDVGPCCEHGLERVLLDTEEVGRQHLDGGIGNLVMQRPDDRRVLAGTPVGDVVAIDGRDDDVTEAHLLRRLREPERLERIHGLRRRARRHIAVAARAGAGIAQDLERRRPSPPALGDVGAVSLLADRVEACAVDELLDLEVAGARAPGARTFIHSARAARPLGCHGLRASPIVRPV